MNMDKVIQELRELNEPVPKPLRLPTNEEIENTQAELGVTFHPDYKKYLLEASDVVFGILEPCTILKDGSHTELSEVADDARNQIGLPKELIPICEDNGDYYCITESGEIKFWSHNGVTDEKWTDLATWIKQVWIEQQ